MNKIVFLDRDGVINRYPGDGKYVTQWEEFSFLPNVLKAIRRLTEEGYKIKVLSNQSGVNKGIYSPEALKDITRRMIREIEKERGRVEVYYCPHREDEGCACRKPKIGLFLKATEGEEVDFKQTYFVGDSPVDVEAGRRIGCRTILVGSGRTDLLEVKSWDNPPDYLAGDLWEATQIILAQNTLQRNGIKKRR
ncbi:MAG: Clp protease [Candidatus Omnitrophota bacterium]|nr:MAG: Clp protease [Candidatus Omnitrophota bacterium]